MRYTPAVITGPSTEPLSIAELKTHLNITTNLLNAQLTMFIQAAREFLEARTGATIHQQTLEQVWNYWPCYERIEFPRATPLISVSSLSYKDSAGNVTTLAANQYVLDTDSMPGGVLPAYGTTWPSFTAYPVNAVRARYVCGIATSSPITEADASIKIATAMLCGVLNENREAETITNLAVANAVLFRYGALAYIMRNVKKYVY